jgi:integrase
MPLTTTALNAAKGKERQYKLRDGEGLFVLVTPSGKRYWRLDFRHGGKAKTMALGVYPTVGLADARKRRDEARKLVASGLDPVQQRKADDRETRLQSGSTFRLVAKEWLEKCKAEGRAEKTLERNEWLLGIAYPLLGDRPIAEINAIELLDVLKKVELRKHHETACRLRSLCGCVFRFAIATCRAKADVSADLKGALVAPKVTHRAAILDPKGVGGLLRAIEAFDGPATIHVALKLAPYLFVRPGELRYAEWSEFDLETAIWTIPAAKAKMRRPHKVPLSRQVRALIRQLNDLSGEGRYLFPCIRTAERPMSEKTINAALRRLGYDKTEMTGHGFRAMASTLLNEMDNWHPDVIERQLGHVDQNEVRRAYARGEYWTDRVAMMQDWSDYLDTLRSGNRVTASGLQRTAPRTTGNSRTTATRARDDDAQQDAVGSRKSPGSRRRS